MKRVMPHWRTAPERETVPRSRWRPEVATIVAENTLCLMASSLTTSGRPRSARRGNAQQVLVLPFV